MDTLNTGSEARTFYGVFNKHTKILYVFEIDKTVAYSYDSNNFLVKEIVLQPSEYYFGDYDTGQVYNELAKPLVREDELEVKFNKEIAYEFPVYQQLCIIVDILDKNKELVKTEEFDKLAKFLRAKKIRYETGLKVMKENKDCYNFVSKQDLQEFAAKRIQGLT